MKNKELEDFAVQIAESSYTRDCRFCAYKDKFGSDADVFYIADHLRSNSRNIDYDSHTVTYRQLETILNYYGFSISPSDNYANIFDVNSNRSVYRIGFPSWAKQVAKEDLNRLRDACGLTIENGIDNHVFFSRSDPVDTLISRYRTPLRNLAYR